MKVTKKSFLEELKNLKTGKRIIDAFEEYEPKDFLDSIFHKKFYTEEPVPIGMGETCDSPRTLARMLHYASPKATSRALEIGTGSGFSTALLASLSKEVATIEFHEELALRAKKRLADLDITNVRFFAGDGTDFDGPLGMFDVIVVYAACYTRPLSLLKLLRPDGRLVFPMGPLHQQQITVAFNDMMKDETDGVIRTTFHELCNFKPIRGQYGTELFHMIHREDPAAAEEEG